jgi:tetratricopeptide (TPR) repeat protein
MTGPFTSRDAARILKLTDDHFRACVRAAGLALRAQSQFTFEELLLLKTARGLLEARIPGPRIKRILDSLRRQLPEDRNLSSVTIYADGRRVVVWDGRARWQPDSGQFLFNFSPSSVAEPAAFPVRRRAEASSRTAADWIALALEWEADSPAEALEAYRQALLLDPSDVEAWINLGRLCHDAGNMAEAERCYREALALSPGEAVAWFNLGLVCEARGEMDAAIDHYRRAIQDDPALREAHQNLALLFDGAGRTSDAIRHWQIVRALDRTDEVARARQRHRYKKPCTPDPDSRPD